MILYNYRVSEEQPQQSKLHPSIIAASIGAFATIVAAIVSVVVANNQKPPDQVKPAPVSASKSEDTDVIDKLVKQGEQEMYSGQIDIAEKTLVEAVRLAEERKVASPRAHALLGNVYQIGLKFDDSLVQFRKAADEDPLLFDANVGLALISIYRGEFSTAELAITRSKRSHDAPAGTRFPDLLQAFYLTERGNASAASDLFEDIFRGPIRPDELPIAHYHRARFFAKQHMFEPALLELYGAVNLGFRSGIIQTDSAFAELRQYPAFDEVLAGKKPAAATPDPGNQSR